MVNISQGDIVMMDFSPQTGHEQQGRRPALVISNDVLNYSSCVCMVCPITNTNKEHPFHVAFDKRTETTGVILCDQAKMLDMDARHARFREKAPQDIWTDARNLVVSFL